MKPILHGILTLILVQGGMVAARGQPAQTIHLKDIAYVPGGHERQKLDLYLPAGEASAPRPLVIWIHGGAWRAGSKEGCPALFLLQDGFAVASINYRLSQHATFPAQLEDCKAAVRWLRANAANHGLDPDRFGCWGASAGGHLVALLGTTIGRDEFDTGPHRDVSSAVQAVCDFFGPTDFLRMNDMPGPMDHDAPGSPESRLIGGPIQEHPEKVRRASPIRYVSGDVPPFLIVHGEEDRLVPPDQSRRLHAALKKAGADSRLVMIQGAGHGLRGPRIHRLVREFFRRTLASTGEDEKEQE